MPEIPSQPPQARPQLRGSNKMRLNTADRVAGIFEIGTKEPDDV